MARVFSAPKGYEFPSFDPSLSFAENDKREDEATERLKERCREISDCRHAGEVIGFPVADGQAMYMILDYKRIIHLPVKDAWSIPDAHARGLGKAELIQKVEQKRALDKIFARA